MNKLLILYMFYHKYTIMSVMFMFIIYFLFTNAAGKMITSNQQGKYILSPNQQGKYILSPNQQGKYILSPNQQGKYILSPEEYGFSAVIMVDVLIPNTFASTIIQTNQNKFIIDIGHYNKNSKMHKLPYPFLRSYIDTPADGEMVICGGNIMNKIENIVYENLTIQNVIKILDNNGEYLLGNLQKESYHILRHHYILRNDINKYPFFANESYELIMQRITYYNKKVVGKKIFSCNDKEIVIYFIPQKHEECVCKTFYIIDIVAMLICFFLGMLLNI